MGIDMLNKVGGMPLKIAKYFAKAAEFYNQIHECQEAAIGSYSLCMAAYGVCSLLQPELIVLWEDAAVACSAASTAGEISCIAASGFYDYTKDTIIDTVKDNICATVGADSPDYATSLIRPTSLEFSSPHVVIDVYEKLLKAGRNPSHLSVHLPMALQLLSRPRTKNHSASDPSYPQWPHSFSTNYTISNLQRGIDISVLHGFYAQVRSTLLRCGLLCTA
jgi:hypothetical protein